MKTQFILLSLAISSAVAFADESPLPQLTNLPTVYLNAPDVNLGQKEVYAPGTVTVVSSDASQVMTDVAINLRGRGNSTMTLDKKPMRMKLDKKANFLNLPAKAKNWVLLANHVDKSLIRNAMAFEMGKFMGFAYTPPIQFVDVVLNGEYVGNYMVTDQIEVNKNRVNVVEQDSASISTGNLTGGYLLEIDGFAGQEPYHFFTTKKNMPVTIKNPKDDENTADQREEMKRYISGYFDEIEDILYSADFKDPEKGWRSRIDEKSLVDWYIVCEYTGNNDAFWSINVYKHRDDPLIYFGPIWDFDQAFGNTWATGQDQILGEGTNLSCFPWMARLQEDDGFKKAVGRRYKELYDDGILDYLLDRWAYYSELLTEPAAMNFKKWDVLTKQIFTCKDLFPTYPEHLNSVREFIVHRTEVLYRHFTGEEVPVEYSVDFKSDMPYSIKNITTGKYVQAVYENSQYTVRLVDDSTQATEFLFEPAEHENGFRIMFPAGTMARSSGYRYITTENAKGQARLDATDDISDPRTEFAFEKSGKDFKICNLGFDERRYVGIPSWDDSNTFLLLLDNGHNLAKANWSLTALREDAGDTTEAQVIFSDESALTFDGTTVYGADGIRILNTAGVTAAASDGRVSVTALPAGIYIATAPGAKALKFCKQ